VSITRIGSATASATTVTIPAHQAGDLILIWAFRGGSTTVPTIPQGWVEVNRETESTATTCAGILCYRIANGSSDTSGTWTNASELICAVYRPSTGYTIRIGQTAVNKSTTNTINYPALSPMADSGGNSWVVGAVGASNLTQTLTTAFTGMTNVTSVSGASYQAAFFDTNAGVTSWPSTNQTVTGTAGKSVTIVAEMVLAPYGVSAGIINVRQHGAAAGNAYTAGQAGNPYVCPISVPLGAGNTLIFAFCAENGQTPTSVSGAINGSLGTAAIHVNAGAGAIDTWTYVLPNISSGQEVVTVTFSTTVIGAASMVSGQSYRITTLGTTNWTALGWTTAAVGMQGQYNGAAVTGSGGQCILCTQAFNYVYTEVTGVATSFTATSGTTVQSNANATTPTNVSLTPPNNNSTGGNFIWSCAFKSSQVPSSNTVNLFPSSPFTLLSADIGWTGGSPSVGSQQYMFDKAAAGCVQTLSAAITPSFVSASEPTGDTWNAVAVALQISNGAGTPLPPNIQLSGVQHFTTTNFPLGTTPTYAMQCPSVGKLRCIVTTAFTNSTITAVRDSEGNTWTNTAGNAGIWFLPNSQPNPNLLVFVDANSTGNNSVSWRYLDITGASASPFDSWAGPLNDNNSGLSSYTTGISPSPISPNTLVIANIALGMGPGLGVTSPSGAIWDLCTYAPSEQDGDKMENADIMAHYNSANPGSETWTFTITNNATNNSIGGFIVFKSSTLFQYSDDEGIFFDSSDDAMAAEVWVEEIASSAPVGPSQPPLPESENEGPAPWWEDYDEPLVEDSQWSSPVQPNAPPLPQPVDDSWTNDDHEGDDYELSTSDSQPVGANALSPARPVDDAWTHEDDHTDEPFGDDSAPVGLNAQALPVEDSLEWTEDVADEDFTDDGYNVQNTNVVPPSQPVEDAWLHEDDPSDEWNADDSTPVGPNQPPLGPDDAWDWIDDEPPYLLVGSYQQTDVLCPAEDAWGWDDHEGDDWDIGDSSTVGTNAAVVVPPGPEDAWTHEDDHTDEPFGDDSAPVGPSQPSPPVEDGYDWTPEDYDEWSADDSYPVGPNYVAPPSPCPEDPWAHEDDNTDDWLLDELAPVGPNQPARPVEDIQGDDPDDRGDDWETWAAADSAPVGPNLPLNFLLGTEDAWSHEDDHTDHWDPYVADSAPVGPNQPIPPTPPTPGPPIPLTAFCCGADYDICIDQNATYTRVITWLLQTAQGESPVNLIGCTASMQIRPYQLSATVLYDASADITLGGTAGTITLSIPSAATENFTWWSGVYDLLITDAYGNVTRLLSGTVTICQGVTVPGHGIQIVTDSGVWLATDSGILIYTS
jgi:hypothetical protein